LTEFSWIETGPLTGKAENLVGDFTDYHD